MNAIFSDDYAALVDLVIETPSFRSEGGLERGHGCAGKSLKQWLPKADHQGP
jgi:hypothetical protein